MTAPPQGSALPHLPALDGLRGCAVLGVLLFHLGVAAVGGGFLGVDAFFVLSGFPITSLLLAEADGGGISLRRFWVRRVRRLLPALLVVLLAVTVTTALVPGYADPGRSRGDGLAALLYVSNWRFALRTEGYFDQGSPLSPLQHTWSLGIEEQFYLLWPLVVLVVVGRARSGHRARLLLAAVALLLALASTAALAVHSSTGDDARQYYGSDTRALSVLLGCALAVPLAGVVQRRAEPPPALRRAGAALGALAAVGVLGAWTSLQAEGPHALAVALPLHALAVAAVLAGVVLAPSSPLSRLLAVPPLQALGRVSYGLYLWHWPVVLLLTNARTGLQGPALMALRAGVSLLLAVLSLWLVEQPVRRRRAAVRAPARAALVAMALTGAAVVAGTPAASPVPTQGPPAVAATRADAQDAPAAPSPAPRTSSAAAPATGRPAPPPGRPGVRVSLLGDSVALTLGQGLAAAPLAGVEVVPRGQLGCGVLTAGPYRYFGDVAEVPEHCLRWPRTWAEAIAQDSPDVVALLVGRWEVMDRRVDGVWQHIGQAPFDARLSAALDDALDTAAASGRPVAVLTAPYYLRGERPDGGRWPEDDPRRVDRFNELLRAAAARQPTATVLELGRRTSADDHRYSRSVDGVELRYDGVHFTAAGSAWLAPWLLPELARLAPQ